MASSSRRANEFISPTRPYCLLSEQSTPPCILKWQIVLHPYDRQRGLYKRYVEEFLTKSFGSLHFELEDGDDHDGPVLIIKSITLCFSADQKCTTWRSQIAPRIAASVEEDQHLRDVVKLELMSALRKHDLRLEE
ncbi:hypothetical protein DL546_006006 [Coniochaeta pulveracea]|uniref:Uncharacterized protein n=1 Tax=Coniochaeta pulveracea TaxID=177199 RepID=A0A420YLQ2_9PEZI|nr:hypothetical protein DL546_006006 [Coniochaeta pulveracea]